ncbi:OsmC domain/YcaO domain-containing protein [Halobacteriovorax vibrionivorans]|uniref:OsmC domain/YcaO domain-containing protein n=1 Tax=Halobacteriovorax vibrionivorans TaxID=2152716 RepID=A0ABY0IK96_9BACT|nr:MULTISPECIES: OsmC domain/YcaO domain-containing protein [Halobacteriovorax]RZF22276.1 OsmC domain/YcaO domain-containing protein [Halobacteriovorax vibrionivorans]TGD48528.1 OsmC domain/YcaO domain-containing protein [Halobacteriovorax sp. Y22]
MQVNVRYLDNLKIEASFDDFKIISDQPVRYKGDGTAPGPYDYFLASSAMCAAYFAKVYCKSRDIPTEDIRISQQNIVDPDNRYKQSFVIHAELPASISEKDKKGILASMNRCTVKRVIQNEIDFKIEAKEILGNDVKLDYEVNETKTMIPGKDCSLEETIKNMTGLLANLGIQIEIASWRNQVPHVWSVHIRDADSPMCFTNGKGATKDAALASALGEYLERISTNYFYSDYYLGEDIANAEFVHYPNEKWFKIPNNESIPSGLMDETLLNAYDNGGELRASNLIDTNSGNKERGICALPFERHSDGQTVYIPANLIANLFVSNGMSAGNTKYEARVQCLSEIFERAVKNQIITEEITLPDVPKSVLEKYPTILEGINKLEEAGFPIVVKDASLGGKFPVMCVTLMNPRNGGVFASFGAHPRFEVALERSLTELLQGRSFEGMNDTFPPTFNEFAIREHNNIVDHFIDSTGVISWRFFGARPQYEFNEWNFSGSTQEEYQYLMGILEELGKEVYIADYNELGASACRILVPEYSEIYQPEDLIWDNHNQALDFREDILNLHSLNNEDLSSLIERLEDSELDNYMPISELIGVAFDESTVWGQLVIGELKALGYLALQNYEEAKHLVEMLGTFNDNTIERRRFYQALNNALDIELADDLEIADYLESFTKMYGAELMERVTKTLTLENRFDGLTQTNSSLIGIDKHLKLIESYKKLQMARHNFFK